MRIRLVSTPSVCPPGPGERPGGIPDWWGLDRWVPGLGLRLVWPGDARGRRVVADLVVTRAAPGGDAAPGPVRRRRPRPRVDPAVVVRGGELVFESVFLLALADAVLGVVRGVLS